MRGYTLLELSVVVSVLGVLSVMSGGLMSDLNRDRVHTQAQADAQLARAALRAYALREKRLPCPDLEGHGRAGDSSGACPSDAQTGWLPYETLNLAGPAPDDDLSTRMAYGVFRSTATDADLVEPKAADSLEFNADGKPDLLAALDWLARRNLGSPSKTNPYITGDGAQYGVADCSNNIIDNPAFIVIVPGTPRRNGEGYELSTDSNSDHARFAAAASYCASAPSRRPDANYGDVVLAESPLELLGWLSVPSH